MQTQDRKIAYEVVHMTPERIRIQIPRLSYDPEYVSRLHFLVMDLADVAAIRINKAAYSLIVEYISSVESINARIYSLQTVIERANDDNLSVPLVEDLTEENPFVRLVLPTVGLGLAVLAASFQVPIPALLIGSITLVGAVPLLISAVSNFLQGRIDAEILNLLWTVLHSLNGEYIAPNLDMTISGSAQVLRETTGHIALPVAKTKLSIQTVRVERNGQESSISVSQLRCGDTLILYPGDMSPIDGLIISGEGLVDVSILTGGLTPVVCTPGKTIMAFSLLQAGKLKVLVERLSEETQYAQEFHLADRTPRHQTLIGEYAEDVSQAITVPAIALSGTTYLLTADVNQALAFLKLDLATGISISAPTTVLSSIMRAQQMGIYIHSGHALETLSQVDVVVFSKTGTLTQGVLRVSEIESFGDIAETDLLCFAASVKEGFKHPVAYAIVRHAQELGINLLPCENWRHCQDIGLGVSAHIGDRLIFVGSSAYLEGEKISPLGIDRGIGLADTEAQGLWRVYVAVDGQLLGRIACCDDIRPESRSVIAELRDRGLEVHMVTSNNWDVAKTVASWVGVESEFVHAQVTPEYKVALLQELKASGKTVAFVGEGMDDYAALRYADVAIGTDRSCHLVAEAADLLLPSGDLSSLLIAFDLATEAIKIIRQNIAIIAVPNISAVILGVLFALDPIISVILYNGANLLAELNGLRPLLDFDNYTKSSYIPIKINKKPATF